MSVKAHKAEKRAAGCSGKQRFVSFTQAHRSATRARRQWDTALTAYACRSCGGFHVGSASTSVDYSTRADPRLPYLVFAHNGDGIECFIGRSNKPDGGKLAQVIAEDGWSVTRVIGGPPC